MRKVTQYDNTNTSNVASRYLMRADDVGMTDVCVVHLAFSQYTRIDVWPASNQSSRHELERNKTDPKYDKPTGTKTCLFPRERLAVGCFQKKVLIAWHQGSAWLTREASTIQRMTLEASIRRVRCCTIHTSSYNFHVPIRNA